MYCICRLICRLLADQAGTYVPLGSIFSLHTSLSIVLFPPSLLLYLPLHTSLPVFHFNPVSSLSFPISHKVCFSFLPCFLSLTHSFSCSLSKTLFLPLAYPISLSFPLCLPTSVPLFMSLSTVLPFLNIYFLSLLSLYLFFCSSFPTNEVTGSRLN